MDTKALSIFETFSAIAPTGVKEEKVVKVETVAPSEKIVYEQDVNGYFERRWPIMTWLVFSLVLFGMSYIAIWDWWHNLGVIMPIVGIFNILTYMYMAGQELYAVLRLTKWVNITTALVLPALISISTVALAYKAVLIG
tara:strand:- start:948 stop:1364 length:417 start_codon:yes stop_codon:yes gene_type:complete